jgi:hypothetical protein
MKEQRTYDYDQVWHEDDGGRIICNGPYKDKDDIFYYKNGKYHREDGPACEWSNGDKEWYFNGYLHRVDGPAIELNNGTKLWHLNNKLHREDGPTCEYKSGDKKWFLNGRLVYSKGKNNIHLFHNLSESFKQSIIKWKLLR